mgnify:CR=1 FL=1
MNTLLHIFILVPFLGFIVSLISKNREKYISFIALSTVGIQLTGAFLFVLFWVFTGFPVLDIKDLVIFDSHDYEFFIDFGFDKITAVYLLVGSVLVFLVTYFCVSYLHRERGYKRFFNNLLFFYMGYNVTIFAGNFETLFIGWEILGLSSFLLIAFYRERYLPVKNALKVFSIYRLGDVGIILAMWMSHHLWHENIKFIKLSNYEIVHHQLQSHSSLGVFISLMILLAACAKSAQFPFSSWLPRAMEGPTPSSAIFYGSLSVHIGVFLLLKTYPFWEHQFSVRILIVFIGLITSVIATLISQVQSSVKSQIAYSSIAQIGLIFIELAAGFDNLALFHFAGNAFLRTYQLLVSPSVVNYLIREQIYNIDSKQRLLVDFLPQKLRYSLYMLSIKEWNMDGLYDKLFNVPVHKTEKYVKNLSLQNILLFFLPLYIIAASALFFDLENLILFKTIFPVFFGIIGLMMVVRALNERKRAEISWMLIVINHFWILLAVLYNELLSVSQISWYLSGIVVSTIGGYFCLRAMKKVEMNINLDRFRGHSYEHPVLAFLFLLCCLGLAGFPITPTFVGEDLLFSHIHEYQYVLAGLVSLSFILNGIAIIRIFALIFLGPHSKTYHELAYKSS